MTIQQLKKKVMISFMRRFVFLLWIVGLIHYKKRHYFLTVSSFIFQQNVPKNICKVLQKNCQVAKIFIIFAFQVLIRFQKKLLISLKQIIKIKMETIFLIFLHFMKVSLDFSLKTFRKKVLSILAWYQVDFKNVMRLH